MRKKSVAARHKLVESSTAPDKLTLIPAVFCPTSIPTARNAFFSSLSVPAIIKKKECLQCSSNFLTNKE